MCASACVCSVPCDWRVIRILVVSLALLASVSLAERPRIQATSYVSFKDYAADSRKDRATYSGIYLDSWLSPSHRLELAMDYSEIGWSDGFEMQQQELTLAYTYAWSPVWSWRMGTHFLDSEDPFSDQARVLFGGVRYGIFDRWDAGLDLSWSRYPQHPAETAATQLTAQWGWNFRRRIDYTWRSELRSYYIHLNRDPGHGDRHLFSLEERLSWITDRWTASIFGWYGRQSFAVRNEGFALFNLAAIHQGGLGCELRVAISASTSIGARLSTEYFLDTPLGPETRSVTSMVSISHPF